MYDTIIIGAGHNGLTCAAQLARAGQRVAVLEARTGLGGVATTEEIFPGFRANVGAGDAHLLHDEMVDALNLPAYGVELVDGAVDVFAPQLDGRSLTLWRDQEKCVADLAGVAPADVERFPAFVQEMTRLSSQLAPFLNRTPQLGDLGTLYTQYPDLVRATTLAATEYLDGWFTSDALKGALGSLSVTGLMQGPRAAGTGLMLLYQLMRAANGSLNLSRFVRGGMGQLAQALAMIARDHGAEIYSGTPVQRILLEEAADATMHAVGVKLADGSEVRANRVASSVDPRRTFLGLVGAPNLEPRFVRAVQHIRLKGSTSQMHLALSALPEFVGQTDAMQLSGHIIIAPSLDAIEQAYDAAKYGSLSPQPCLAITMPTLLDPSLAPAGQQIMAVTVRYTPYHLRDSSWAAEAARMGEGVLNLLERHAPGIRKLILHQKVITPPDWERDYGLTEGSIHHGQMELAQMLAMRPMAGWGDYRTPVDGLWLCGAGTHPGGGVTGMPGWNAARAILTWAG